MALDFDLAKSLPEPKADQAARVTKPVAVKLIMHTLSRFAGHLSRSLRRGHQNRVLLPLQLHDTNN